MTVPIPKDYRFVRAWGAMMHSHKVYIDTQVERARREGAPADAIYRGEDRWHTVGEVNAAGTLSAMANTLENMGFNRDGSDR